MKSTAFVAILAVLALAIAPLWSVNAEDATEPITIDVMEPISVDVMEPISVDVMEPISVDAYGLVILHVGDVQLVITPDCDLAGTALILFFDEEGYFQAWNLEDCFPTAEQTQSRAGARNSEGGFDQVDADRSNEIHSWWGHCDAANARAIIIIFGDDGMPEGYCYLDCFPTDYTIGDVMIAMSIISSIV